MNNSNNFDAIDRSNPFSDYNFVRSYQRFSRDLQTDGLDCLANYRFDSISGIQFDKVISGATVINQALKKYKNYAASTATNVAAVVEQLKEYFESFFADCFELAYKYHSEPRQFYFGTRSNRIAGRNYSELMPKQPGRRFSSSVFEEVLRGKIIIYETCSGPGVYCNRVIENCAFLEKMAQLQKLGQELLLGDLYQ